MARLRPPGAVRAVHALAVALCVLSVAACSSGGGRAGVETARSTTTSPGSSDLPEPPSPSTVVVATAVVPDVAVFDSPDAPTPSRRVANPRPSGAPAVFLVIQRRGDWAEVLLPVRPGGGSGWVRYPDVLLTKHGWRIVVELAAHRLTLFQGDGVVRVETIGVGTASTPTPGGRYFTTELLQPLLPDGPYGPYAVGINAFTGEGRSGETNAVQGQLGIHGTNDPATLGRDVSLGCIRVSNAAISAMALELPLGVPVVIKP